MNNGVNIHQVPDRKCKIRSLQKDFRWVLSFENT